MSISAVGSQAYSQSTMPDESVISISQALGTRRSVRAFSAAPLDDALVDEILETALAAPSWGNVQPYRVAVTCCSGIMIANTMTLVSITIFRL